MKQAATRILLSIIVITILACPEFGVGQELTANDTEVTLPEDWPSHVELKLVAAQPRYVQFEPISIIVSQVNRGPGALPAVPKLDGYADLLVNREGEPARKYYRIWSYGFAVKDPPWLPKTPSSWLCFLREDGLRFRPAGKADFLADAPGVYEIRYRVTFDGLRYATSNTLKIKVEPPTAEDRELLEYLENVDVRVLVRPGFLAPKPQSTREFLDEITVRFPRSSYVPYALLKLAKLAVARSQEPEDIDQDLAFRCALAVLERFPNSAVAEEMSALLIDAADILGREDQLRPLLPRMREIDAKTSVPALQLERILLE